MAIQLDNPTTSSRPPVVGAREVGARCVGMVISKEVRERRNKEGNPIPNSRGGASKEEVHTVIIMDGTTGTVSGGDLADDATPEVGSIGRFIWKGMDYNRLIDARNAGATPTSDLKKGAMGVGDVIDFIANSATIWRGAGDIAMKDVTDPELIVKARAKGLSVSFDKTVTYRRPNASEAALVARAEQMFMEQRQAVALDAADELDPF